MRRRTAMVLPLALVPWLAAALAAAPAAALPAPLPAPPLTYAPAHAPHPASAPPDGSPVAAARIGRHLPTPALAPARLPGFAAELAERPPAAGPALWRPMRDAAAWAALAGSTRGTRQAARWRHAASLIGRGRGHEAAGVLAVMLADDPDLALVPAFALARGAALTLARRPAEALPALAGLPGNAEACLWRMRALAAAGLAEQAVAEAGCAAPALAARRPAQRIAFLIAAAGAAVDAGQPARAQAWLAGVPDRHPAANLERARAALALGAARPARLLLERVQLSGSAAEKIAARLALVEARARDGSLQPAAALAELERIRFTWRGDAVEERALRLSAELATDSGATAAALGAGAALFRYFDLGADSGAVLAGLQETLAGLLAGGGRLSLAEAAGLYWEYRDLAPTGAEGDRLVRRLADRLAAAGLYGRAAEILRYQLTARADDLAQGPLSARVAGLYILAGRPDRALAALAETAGVAYPQAIAAERARVEAAALHLLGRTAEALAVVQDLPDGAAIAAELMWQARDWAGLARSAPLPGGGGRLEPVGQVAVLRQAIALAMLGREAELGELRRRYEARFAGTDAAGAFDLLTRPAGSVPDAALAGAMRQLPAASPAGAVADLIDAAPPPARPAPGRAA